MAMTLGKVRPFKSAQKAFANLNGAIVGQLIASASDVALLIDKAGTIKDVSLGSDFIEAAACSSWIGRHWIDTVTVDSRIKVREMLDGATGQGVPRWRQVNQSLTGGESIPIGYRALNMADDGRVIAVGRDLRAMASAQQRLVEAQQSMEREYSRYRVAETRFRFIFQSSSEAIVIVDRDTLKVSDINPSALAMFKAVEKGVTGRSFLDLFDVRAAEQVNALLQRAINLGQSNGVKCRPANARQEVMLGASLFRQDNMAHLLVRCWPVMATSESISASSSTMLRVVESVPQGFVVTRYDGRIAAANQAFLSFAGLGTEEQARGEVLERFLGRNSIDFKVMLANVKEHGSLRLFATTLKGAYGMEMDVEISAVSVPDSNPPSIGFVIHDTAGRTAASDGPQRETPRSVSQMRDLVGRAPLKEIVRETTDEIERLCIEAALQLTGDNRASAAEMLGLSRQGLYDKLRRHKIGELDS